MDDPADVASLATGSAIAGFSGLISTAKRLAFRRSSCKKPSRFAVISTIKVNTLTVAARSIQAGHEASLDRITASAKNYRKPAGRRECCRRALRCRNNGYLTTNQIGC